MVKGNGCIRKSNLYLCDKRYIYLSQFNLIINKEFKELFFKYRANLPNIHPNVLNEFRVTKEFLINKTKELSAIIFQVTQNCNLNCEYCVYGGTYLYHRNKAKRDLGIETAKRGIDFIHNIVGKRGNHDFFIGFYGGEPLLKYRTIKDITEYARKIFTDQKIMFSITTNGTLLTDEIINFLILNNFLVTISLDGPKEIHDAKRIFNDKTGTFQIIKDNLARIQEINKAYFLTNVSISAVWSKDLDLQRIYNFFLKDQLIRRLPVTLGPVTSMDTSYYKIHPIKDNSSFHNLEEILNTIFHKVLNNKKLSPMESYLFQLSYQAIDDCLKISTFNPSFYGCNFGQRLFIDVDGNFHVCEKINDKFSYGNVIEGFDFAKMEKIANQFIKLNRYYCLSCSMKFLCQRCYVTFAKNGKFEINHEFCKKKFESRYFLLEKYIKLNEEKNRQTNKIKKVKKFHQYIHIEKGPSNSAIVDFLKGNIFQVENDTIENFEQKKFQDIKEFLKQGRDQELLIDVDEETWIPYINLKLNESDVDHLGITMELEEGAPLGIIKSAFRDYNIDKISFYGEHPPIELFPSTKMIRGNRDFSQCIKTSRIEGQFEKIDEAFYRFNMRYNSCWGKNIAITKAGIIKPCFFSEIKIGDIRKDNIKDILFKLEKRYWTLTKDKVKTCKDCELRYVCFDCREIAWRQHKNLFDSNPNCRYDPYRGIWSH